MHRKPLECNRIFIFNLETNLDSHVLAAGHDWIEAFSHHFDTVEVYSTHVKRTDLTANVRVKELGGGSPYRKLKNLYRLLKVIPRIWKYRDNAIVFHHMSSRTLAVLGLPVRLMRIPQGIWYSHSKADWSLRIGSTFADMIFTSTEYAYPLRSNKLKFIGHGIKLNNKKQAGSKEPIQ